MWKIFSSRGRLLEAVRNAVIALLLGSLSGPALQTVQAAEPPVTAVPDAEAVRSTAPFPASAESAPERVATSGAPSPAATAPAANRQSLAAQGMLPLADTIIIHKGQRRMDMLKGQKVLRSYRIALGLRPIGSKEEEGDFRTPEGKYRIVRRNARSDYFLSLQISYPNDADVARSRRKGVAPGGAIMIHGTPNVPRKPLDYYRSVDWTDGCIAVTNSEMVEIWLMTSNDTPVEILP